MNKGAAVLLSKLLTKEAKREARKPLMKTWYGCIKIPNELLKK